MSDDLRHYFETNLPNISSQAECTALMQELPNALAENHNVAQIQQCMRQALDNQLNTLFTRESALFKLADYPRATSPDLSLVFSLYIILRDGHAINQQILDRGIDTEARENYYYNFVEVVRDDMVNAMWHDLDWTFEDAELLKFKLLLILGNGGNVNYRDESNVRPLYWAIHATGNIDNIKMLLLFPSINLDCIANTEMGRQISAFEVAIKENRIEMLELLLNSPKTNLQQGLGDNIGFTQGQLLLNVALKQEQAAMVLMLIKYGARVSHDSMQIFAKNVQQLNQSSPEAWKSVVDKLEKITAQQQRNGVGGVQGSLWNNRGQDVMATTPTDSNQFVI